MKSEKFAAVIVAVLTGVLVVGACSAPPSRQATGPIADAVKNSLESGADSFHHDEWDDLLAISVKDALVDYRKLQQHRQQLDAYLERLGQASLGTLSPVHLEALLINAYNALTIRSILDHPGVRSIREIDGVWDGITHQVGGFPLTLDEIEHNILRPFFKDPRLHFALNCASFSCAPLPPWAFTGDEIDEQLEERANHFLSNPDNLRVEAGALVLSRYFDWYGDDFVKQDWEPRGDSIPLFVAQYASPPVRAFLADSGSDVQLNFLEYDWTLNAVAQPDMDGAGQADEGPIARLRGWILDLGPAGIGVYMVVYVLLTVLFVPAWPLTVGAGAGYGVLLGTAIVSVSSVIGAALAFLVARYLLRARVEKWVEGNRTFASIDRAVGRQGWKIVALTRLSPLFPFNLQNYAYGLTAVGFWRYVAASWLAMLPGTLLYVYIGAAGAEVAEAATGQVNWLVSGLKWAGLAATLAVTLLITRLARSALREAAQEAAETDPA